MSLDTITNYTENFSALAPNITTSDQIEKFINKAVKAVSNEKLSGSELLDQLVQIISDFYKLKKEYKYNNEAFIIFCKKLISYIEITSGACAQEREIIRNQFNKVLNNYSNLETGLIIEQLNMEKDKLEKNLYLLKKINEIKKKLTQLEIQKICEKIELDESVKFKPEQRQEIIKKVNQKRAEFGRNDLKSQIDDTLYQISEIKGDGYNASKQRCAENRLAIRLGKFLLKKDIENDELAQCFENEEPFLKYLLEKKQQEIKFIESQLYATLSKNKFKNKLSKKLISTFKGLKEIIEDSVWGGSGNTTERHEDWKVSQAKAKAEEERINLLWHMPNHVKGEEMHKEHGMHCRAADEERERLWQMQNQTTKGFRDGGDVMSLLTTGVFMSQAMQLSLGVLEGGIKDGVDLGRQMNDVVLAPASNYVSNKAKQAYEWTGDQCINYLLPESSKIKSELNMQLAQKAYNEPKKHNYSKPIKIADYIPSNKFSDQLKNKINHHYTKNENNKNILNNEINKQIKSIKKCTINIPTYRSETAQPAPAPKSKNSTLTVDLYNQNNQNNLAHPAFNLKEEKHSSQTSLAQINHFNDNLTYNTSNVNRETYRQLDNNLKLHTSELNNFKDFTLNLQKEHNEAKWVSNRIYNDRNFLASSEPNLQKQCENNFPKSWSDGKDQDRNLIIEQLNSFNKPKDFNSGTNYSAAKNHNVTNSKVLESNNPLELKEKEKSIQHNNEASDWNKNIELNQSDDNFEEKIPIFLKGSPFDLATNQAVGLLPPGLTYDFSLENNTPRAVIVENQVNSKKKNNESLSSPGFENQTKFPPSDVAALNKIYQGKLPEINIAKDPDSNFSFVESSEKNNQFIDNINNNSASDQKTKLEGLRNLVVNFASDVSEKIQNSVTSNKKSKDLPLTVGYFQNDSGGRRYFTTEFSHVRILKKDNEIFIVLPTQEDSNCDLISEKNFNATKNKYKISKPTVTISKNELSNKKNLVWVVPRGLSVNDVEKKIKYLKTLPNLNFEGVEWSYSDKDDENIKLGEKEYLAENLKGILYKKLDDTFIALYEKPQEERFSSPSTPDYVFKIHATNHPEINFLFENTEKKDFEDHEIKASNLTVNLSSLKKVELLDALFNFNEQKISKNFFPDSSFDQIDSSFLEADPVDAGIYANDIRAIKSESNKQKISSENQSTPYYDNAIKALNSYSPVKLKDYKTLHISQKDKDTINERKNERELSEEPHQGDYDRIRGILKFEEPEFKLQDKSIVPPNELAKSHTASATCGQTLYIKNRNLDDYDISKKNKKRIGIAAFIDRLIGKKIIIIREANLPNSNQSDSNSSKGKSQKFESAISFQNTLKSFKKNLIARISNIKSRFINFFSKTNFSTKRKNSFNTCYTYKNTEEDNSDNLSEISLETISSSSNVNNFNFNNEATPDIYDTEQRPDNKTSDHKFHYNITPSNCFNNENNYYATPTYPKLDNSYRILNPDSDEGIFIAPPKNDSVEVEENIYENINEPFKVVNKRNALSSRSTLNDKINVNCEEKNTNIHSNKKNIQELNDQALSTRPLPPVPTPPLYDQIPQNYNKQPIYENINIKKSNITGDSLKAKFPTPATRLSLQSNHLKSTSPTISLSVNVVNSIYDKIPRNNFILEMQGNTTFDQNQKVAENKIPGGAKNDTLFNEAEVNQSFSNSSNFFPKSILKKDSNNVQAKNLNV